MTYKTFAIHIIGLTLCCALLNLGVVPFCVFPKFAWASLLLFLNISLVAFFLAKLTTNANYKNTFIGVYMGISAFKLISAPTLVFWYKSTYNPTDTLFIVPFLVFFLLFMVYETYFLGLVAKE
jgi:hypothetical protein